MSNNGNRLPSLRFPAFENDPAWEEKKLGDVTNYKQPTRYIVNSTKYSNTYNTPVLTAGKSFILGYTNEVTGIYTNTPVIIFDDFTTTSHYVDFNFKVKSSAMKILKSENGNNLKFIYESMQGLYFPIGGHKRYWISEFSHLKFNIPLLLEQQKIADCLTSLDDLITAKSLQIESLKQHKKGLMQQLFPQVNATTPNLRFPVFKNTPAWEEKKLGGITHKKSSNISLNKLENNQGKYALYGAIGFIKNVDFYTEDSEYIAILKDGAGVGRLLYCKPKTSVLGTLDIITVKPNIDAKFLFLLLQNFNFTKYIVGSGIPHIYYKNYKNETVALPASILEQQKIADCLTSLDNLITAKSLQIESLKQHKKGLMQQLFPNNETSL